MKRPYTIDRDRRDANWSGLWGGDSRARTRKEGQTLTPGYGNCGRFRGVGAARDPAICLQLLSQLPGPAGTRCSQDGMHTLVVAQQGRNPSRLVSAAVAEREKLRRRLQTLTARQSALRDELDRVLAERGAIEEQLLILNRLTHGQESPARTRSRTDTRDLRTLRGRGIRETAVRLLASSEKADDVIHHSDWYAMFVDAGFAASGRDPANSFLVQIGRSPLVSRGDRPGTYYLDLGWPSLARTRLTQLRARLARAEESVGALDATALDESRRRRTQLAGEIGRLERDLSEALRSLEPRGPEPISQAA